VNITKKIKNHINKISFNKTIEKIKYTKPLKYKVDSNVIILTQVHSAAVNMYITAMKSFMYFFGRGTLKALNDGSLTTADKALITEHLPGIEIVELSTIDTEGFPSGGTWERLLYIVELSKDAYVIQIDSDTLTFRPIPEIDNAVVAKRGFCIGSPTWSQLISASYISDIANRWDSDHVQVKAEQIFSKIPFFNNRKYLRGCSAVTGFPKGEITRELLLEFSSQVQEELGEVKWSEWGSEQVSSNVMVAQTNEPIILPWPKYQNFDFPESKNSIESQSIIHFIGTNRFNRNVYKDLAIEFFNKVKTSK